ncbi:tetratricopeptide repeat protein [Martelella sp. HB161492]|uniref:tetratricopeptide repeat protein n=1 Tax=Martelella sp. HB161492 TaxID=2720726 RepID=UPI0015909AA0|nr:tetratricopeptide repeat protein [Martelella sp. HB161492]
MIKRSNGLAAAFLMSGFAIASPALAQADAATSTVETPPALAAPVPERGSRLVSPEDLNVARTPSGLKLYARMGSPLPELPPEKPYDGPVDEAYGAYQRGMFQTAYSEALKRAHQGDADAETLIAVMLDKDLISKARAGSPSDWYRMAAESDSPAAKNRYGMMLLSGQGVAKDPAKGEALVRAAAEAGNAEAAYNLATLIISNAKGSADGTKDALPWYERAANAGIPEAEYALSQIYLADTSLPEEQRITNGFWLYSAAKDGLDTAQIDLALRLVSGRGGQGADPEQAFEWMHRAAISGNPAAQSKLGDMFRDGVGTKKDPVSAATFYLLSQRSGLSEPKVDTYLKQLPADQLKLAEARANTAAGKF